MTTTRGTPRSGGRVCCRKSTRSSPFQVRPAAHQAGGGAFSFSAFSFSSLLSGPGAARAAGTFTRCPWGLSWGTSGRRLRRHQVWVGGRQGPSRFRPGRRGRVSRQRLFFKVVQLRPGRGRPFRILPVAQAVLGAPVGGPHQMQVLAHRGRPHHDPLLLGQGLGQLRGRPGALARQQPVQGPPHLPAPLQVRPRPQLPVAHGLEALFLELADPAAHRGLAAVEVARQRRHRHPVGREQVHFDPVPLAGGQVRVAAQLHQAPALAGGELDVQGGGHGGRAPDHRWTRFPKDSACLDIGPHEGLS